MIPRNLQITIALLLVGVLISGMYLLRLRERAQRVAAATSDSRPVAAPVAGPTEKVPVLIAYDDDAVLRREETTATLPQETTARAKEVLREVIARYVKSPSPHTLAEGSDVRDVYIVNDDLLVVDLNAALADGHRSGALLEEFTVVSFVETLAMNIPQVRGVKFIVEGKERETLAGHAGLQQVYDVAAVHQLVAELR
jgi:hypothetical protein